MKGVTLNNLDINISGSYTENDLDMFEQTGLMPNEGPPSADRKRKDDSSIFAGRKDGSIF